MNVGERHYFNGYYRDTIMDEFIKDSWLSWVQFIEDRHPSILQWTRRKGAKLGLLIDYRRITVKMKDGGEFYVVCKNQAIENFKPYTALYIDTGGDTVATVRNVTGNPYVPYTHLNLQWIEQELRNSSVTEEQWWQLERLYSIPFVRAYIDPFSTEIEEVEKVVVHDSGRFIDKGKYYAQ